MANSFHAAERFLQRRYWSLITLWEKLIKIGVKIVRHARYVTFQMDEVAASRKLFREILRRTARLKTKRLFTYTGTTRCLVSVCP